jgi:predicted esterase
MAGIIDALDPDYDFVFIEGEIERPAAPGVPAGTLGPFYSYYDDPSHTSIRSACDLIDVVLEEEGPFDGFIGFSQGAAVGVSYVMDRQTNNPNEQCPFQWMLLFSCTIALSPEAGLYDLQFELRDMLRKKTGVDGTITVAGVSHGTQHGIDTSSRGSKLVRSTNRELYLTDPAAFGALEDDYYALIEAFVQSAQNEGKERIRSRHQDAFDNPSTTNALIFYHPGITSERVPVPSIHCVGRNDTPEIREQSKLIRDLCEEGDTTYLEHTSGHDIPRDSITVQAIAKAVRRLIEDSRWKARRPIC